MSPHSVLMLQKQGSSNGDLACRQLQFHVIKLSLSVTVITLATCEGRTWTLGKSDWYVIE